MPIYKFIAEQTGDGAESIAVLREEPGRLLRRATSERVPLGEWPKLAPVAGQTALAAARALDPDGEIIEAEDSVLVPAAIIARLDELDAGALGLPPATVLTLQLNSTGSLAERTIAVDAKWVKRGGMPVRPEITGARVRTGDQVARIPEPMFSIYRDARGVNAAIDPDARLAAFAQLRETLGDEANANVTADGFLERVRIAYAANFSLSARTDHGRFDFDPVLFSRTAVENPDGDLVDEEEASLLTHSDAQRFKRKFREQDGGRRSYLLADGTILFVDPKLGSALDIVRAKQRAGADERRDFLRSPQRVLREEMELDASDDDEAADRLFVETQQFSERVNGIEVWQKPVLPWIKPKPNSWLPEGFGIRVGEPPDARHIELAPGEAEVLVGEVENAIASGAENVAWKDETIPATPATLNAAKAIAGVERQVSEAQGEGDKFAEDGELQQTFFLQVGENFEQLDYSRLPRPDGETAPFTPPPLPAGLRSTPKPHQELAFAWLTEAWTRRLPGVLLADDMGLGKTFQSLMFLLWLRCATDNPGPVLIVAPTGLLRNWQAEMAQHVEAGLMGEVVEAFGSGLARYRTGSGSDIRGGTSRLEVSDWTEAGVVLTTYETMRDYHMSFASVPFAAIVYDEIQKLKNPASQMTRAAKTLNGRLQIAMTGTPVENRLQDLWSIADTVYPGFLGASRDFEKTYPANDHEALADLQSRLVNRAAGAPAFMLRRMKDEILTGLPTKTARKYAVMMPDAQLRAYDTVLARARALRESGTPGAMLKVLHLLRGTSLHPRAPHGIDDFEGYIGESARLAKTFEILAEVRDKGEKALVFCEDLEMQAFLATAIQDKFDLPQRPMCINGGVAGPRRQEMVSRFQQSRAPFDVLILSPKAGGVGLTITAANHVIHLSRWWNPAVEDQATDRAYRIGQTRPVTIHIPLAIHPDEVIGPSSFDQRLDNLMERKRSLSRGLLMPPESDGDVEELLSEVLDGRSAPAQGADGDLGEDLAASAGIVASDKDVGSAMPPEATSAESGRPVLSLRTPVEVAEARTPAIQRAQFEANAVRDWSIFEQYAQGAEVAELRIEDPWCCANERAVRLLVDFVRRLEAMATSIDEVRIVTFDAKSAKSQDFSTSYDQLCHLQDRWGRHLPSVPLKLSQKSKYGSADLHDRSVRAKLKDGGTVIWDIGRGIDGVMNARFSCVVNALREPATAG